jgi:hypothetical protein
VLKSIQKRTNSFKKCQKECQGGKKCQNLSGNTFGSHTFSKNVPDKDTTP